MRQRIAHLNKIVVLFFACAMGFAGEAYGQRDFKMMESRHFLLSTENAAGLTSYKDTTICKADIFLNHRTGDYRTISEGKRETMAGADIRSYYRFTDRLVAYGNAAFRSFNGTEMDGSMLFASPTFEQTMEVRPFDILDDSTTNVGEKHYELYRMVGGIGWTVCRNLAVGARMDFTAGNYAKYKDLRHRNTLMNLAANIGVMYKGWGGSFIYRRNTETVQFDMYGTTDHEYKSLIDYANGIGEIETYGGDGFTDGSIEQPIFNEYTGFGLQCAQHTAVGDFGGAFTYMHRKGYYGKESQYTASHEQHSGDVLDWKVRYTLPRSVTGSSMQWIDFHLNDETLTAQRNNYSEVMTDNNGITSRHYEYYTPTKMSDKTLRQGTASFTGYFSPLSNTLFLWHVNAGLSWIYSKQTAYLFPEITTVKNKTYIPFATIKRNFLLRNTKMISAELGFASTERKDGRATTERIKISYEFPCVAIPSLRPNISLTYNRTHHNNDALGNGNRHTLLLSIGATF